eukprot:452909_1
MEQKQKQKLIFNKYTMSLLKKAKHASKRINKYIVFGYIHEHEMTESVTIPLLISYMGLSYYYIPEYFSKARTDYFEISSDSLTVRNIGEHCSTSIHSIYCNQWIHSNSKIMAKWTFKINKFQYQYKIYFGLISTPEN